jgi:beta-lactamase regulating signal transducer with metallopeptidase domain
MVGPLAENLVRWVEQGLVVASVGALLPKIFHLRHPPTQLVYGHVVLAVCLLLPFLQPWRDSPQPGRTPTTVLRPIDRQTVRPPAPIRGVPQETRSVTVAPDASLVATPDGALTFVADWSVVPDGRAKAVVLWILAIGVAARLSWLLVGLWRVRTYRIAATPLYPIPESVRAASALTHADALVCLSSDSSSPVMLGWLTPVVLLPESFLALEEEAQCCVVCHELLHVKRHDWLITVFEELSAALLWFNPAAWWLLAQTRLAREQVVDAEVVRLTAAREPYIEALLAIARGRPVLDLAPAPLFLRRRHLTQRMHALLKDVPMSRLTLWSSYASMTVIVTGAAWYGCLAFPLVGRAQARDMADLATMDVARPSSLNAPARGVVQASATPPVQTRVPAGSVSGDSPRGAATVAFQGPPGAGNNGTTVAPQPPGQPARPLGPVPYDPLELVTSPPQTIVGNQEVRAVVGMLTRARGNLAFGPVGAYTVTASFTAYGPSPYAGPGEMTETRVGGARQWIGRLGDFSLARMLPGAPLNYDLGTHGPIPMRIQMVRETLFGPINNVFLPLRTASATLDGVSLTCVLTSVDGPTAAARRDWSEVEHCIEPRSGRLQIYSEAPGLYVVYDYSHPLWFNGHTLPGQITITVAGSVVLQETLRITDPGPIDLVQFTTPTNEMWGPGLLLIPPTHLRLRRGGTQVPSTSVQAVIVHATLGVDGYVVEAESLQDVDGVLSRSAMELVKSRNFGSGIRNDGAPQHARYS